MSTSGVLDDLTNITGRVYVGQRGLDNALSTPLTPQLAPTSSGGIVAFTRVYAGAGILVSRTRCPLDADRNLRRHRRHRPRSRASENRQGYIDDAGVQGCAQSATSAISSTTAAMPSSRLAVGLHPQIGP